jgi:hypothetical protein
LKQARPSNGTDKTYNQPESKIKNGQKRMKPVNTVKDQLSMEIELPQTPKTHFR